MSSVRPDWSWQPDEAVLAALARGRQKLRRQQPEEIEVAKTKKKAVAKKAKKKLDGKALAANRKPRDSVAQFIKDELNAGKTDVAKILERCKADFPKANPTAGYVRFIAKQIGKSKQVESQRGKGEKKAKPAKKASKKVAKKTSTKKSDAPASAETSPDPAS